MLYIILFAYSSMMCKPVLPYLNDLIAHTLFYQFHMATVHFENGKLHVHKEVMKETAAENDKNKPVQLKKDNLQSDHILIAVPILDKLFDSRFSYNTFPLDHIPSLSFPIFIPPPQTLA